jgi:hypothetical protein
MFEQHAITAMADIPPLVAAFAADAGWTVVGTTLTRAGGGLSFTLAAAIAGYDHTLTWTNGVNNARIVSPKLGGTASVPVVSIPSKVYLFGDADFIAIVVEYGFNSYRHLYLGNMVKAGDYTGGEVISGCTPLASNSGSSYPMSFRAAAYLFAARQTVHSSANCGGVNVSHVDNPTQWRKFSGPVNDATPLDGFNNATALGGYVDDINDAYVARGRSSYAGAQILVPINLYASMPITGDTRFAPLGHPAGVRMVNMADIDPAGTFMIGAETWQCFPALAKSVSTTVAQTSGGAWAVGETSYLVGYAYPHG